MRGPAAFCHVSLDDFIDDLLLLLDNLSLPVQ